MGIDDGSRLGRLQHGGLRIAAGADFLHPNGPPRCHGRRSGSWEDDRCPRWHGHAPYWRYTGAGPRGLAWKRWAGPGHCLGGYARCTSNDGVSPPRRSRQRPCTPDRTDTGGTASALGLGDGRPSARGAAGASESASPLYAGCSRATRSTSPQPSTLPSRTALSLRLSGSCSTARILDFSTCDSQLCSTQMAGLMGHTLKALPIKDRNVAVDEYTGVPSI